MARPNSTTKLRSLIPIWKSYCFKKLTNDVILRNFYHINIYRSYSKTHIMRIAVIGGAGYIGSHVVKALLKQQHEIVVYDNLSTGHKENIFPNTKFIEGDILNKEKLSESLKGCDAIVHLAASKAAGESMTNPEKYSTNNITGTINILNAASENKIKYIVFSSSAAVYGNPEYLPVDEKHPTKPINYYGFTKLEIERILKWYDKLLGIKFAALRYFNAVGYDIDGEIKGLEINPANLLPIVMEVAVGQREQLQIFGDDYDTPDGTCIRDYIHVTDLANAHLKALEYIMKGKSLTVNLASESGLSVMDVVKCARKVTGKPIPTVVVGRREGDPAKLAASSVKAHEILGWKAEYSDPETVLKTTWDVYKDHFFS
jgi:UDP-glucose 4-epimerase